MAAVASTQLCSLQARPAKPFSRTSAASSASRWPSRVMAVSKDSSSHRDQTNSQKLMALAAAAQLVFAGSAWALDTPSPSDASNAAESAKGKLPSLPNPFFGRSDKANQGPQDASANIQDSIKKSQGGKTNEADALADKLNTAAPASGAPSTAGVGKSLGTTDGGL